MSSQSHTETPIDSALQPDAKLHIRMPFQGRRARKIFVRGLGIPRHLVYAVLRGIKTCFMPREVRVRRQIAQAFVRSTPDLASWLQSGYRTLEPEELGNTQPAIEICRGIQREAQARDWADPSGAKTFLRYVASDQDFLAYPEVLQFVLSENILRAVSAYLGSVPVLSSVALLWSPPLAEGTPPTSSQRFHNDHEDLSQVKLFLHVNDVEPDHGVFTFHRAETTRRVRKALGTKRGRLDDEDVAKVAGGERPIEVSGPAGMAIFVDTSRCLHFGSRPSRKHRLVFQAQYLRCNSPTYSNLALTLDANLANQPWSSLQRRVLGLKEPRD